MPNKFSYREGYIQFPDPMQLEELPQGFRLEIELCMTKALDLYNRELRYGKKETADWEEILRDIWVQFLDQPLAQYNGMYQVHEFLLRIIHHGEFYEVFDVVEELTNRIAPDQPKFYKDLKEVFERRRIAYRLIGSNPTGFVIVPTVSDLEALTISSVFDYLILKSPKFDLVSKHLLKAAQYLRDGEDSKSIGESSSALEGFFRIIGNSDKEYTVVSKESLKSIPIHPIIKNRIDVPYNFASDISNGRHSSKQAGYNADRYDAQYIFTHCCFDIQYLINKQNFKISDADQSLVIDPVET